MRRLVTIIFHALAAVLLSFSLSSFSTAGDRDWRYSYDSDGQVLLADGPRLPEDVIDQTRFVYDSAGNLVKTTNALGHVVLLQDYNAHGQPGQIRDANGVETLLEYSARGWLVKRTVRHLDGDPAKDSTTSYEYDGEGQLLSTTTPDGVTLRNEYDAAHRLVAMVNKLGERIDYTLDGAGNRTSVQVKTADNSLVRSISVRYDGPNMPSEVTGEGIHSSMTYDENQNLRTHFDSNSISTIFIYDAYDRVTTTRGPLGYEVQYQYDDQHNLTAVTDPSGMTTRYEYDGLNNLKSISSPDTGLMTATYDAAGNRLSETDATGRVTHYTYDALNRVSAISYTPAYPGKNVSYIYDNGGACTSCQGRLREVIDGSGKTSYGYDHLGNVTLRSNEVKLPGGENVTLTTRYSYNKAGNLIQMEYPNGQVVVYGRGGLGRINEVSRKDALTAPQVPVASSIAYQPFGPIKAADFGNGLKMSRNYNLDGFMTMQSVTAGTTTKQSLVYTYDGNANILSIEDLVDADRSETYAYDELNRLVSASGVYGELTYLYDSNHNRVARVYNQVGQAALTERYTYSQASNRLDRVDIDSGSAPAQRNFLYDPNGNLVDETRADSLHRKFYYDVTNRMERVSP